MILDNTSLYTLRQSLKQERQDILDQIQNRIITRVEGIGYLLIVIQAYKLQREELIQGFTNGMWE